MFDRSRFYSNPASMEELPKRITIIPERLDEEAKIILQDQFSDLVIWETSREKGESFSMN